MARYIFGFLVTIGLIVLVLFLIFSGGNNGSTSPTIAKPIDLRDYANNDNVRAQLIISGPLVADQNYQSIEIDVTQDQVALTVYKGYQRTMVRTKSYVNNANAFADFMYGLQRSGFTQGNNAKALNDDRGFCVAGIHDRYTFDKGNDIAFSYWSTTCGQGTFKGAITTVVPLFKNQIPGYDALTQDQSL